MGTAIFAQKMTLFDKNAKGTFLIENTEGKFALEHKETGMALRWQGLGHGKCLGCCGEFLDLTSINGMNGVSMMSTF
jgi:proteasome assembly chaperone (PAC2) family protein